MYIYVYIYMCIYIYMYIYIYIHIDIYPNPSHFTIDAPCLGLPFLPGVIFGGTLEAAASKLGLPHPRLSDQQRQMSVVKFLGTAGSAVGEPGDDGDGGWGWGWSGWEN